MFSNYYYISLFDVGEVGKRYYIESTLTHISGDVG